MKIANVKKTKIPVSDNKAFTKVVEMGHITELVVMEKRPCAPPIRKVDKEHFVDLRTGEYKEFSHSETKADSIESVRHTLAHIRALINTNVTDPNSCRWVTLTYADNMTDPKRLYQDFSAFWRRFKRYCKKMGYSQPEYITVQEPQGRGAWHIHAFFIWADKAPFIPSSDKAKASMKDPPKGVKSMQELWEQGFTSVKALNDVDNIGAYFSAYLADMPLDEVNLLPDKEKSLVLQNLRIEQKSFENAQEQVKDKKFVKGGRLYLYPVGMNILRRTKGIKDPDISYTIQEKAKEKVSSAKLTFSSNIEILNDDGEVVNRISRLYYNSSRK